MLDFRLRFKLNPCHHIEYDWTDDHGGDSLSSYLSRIEDSSVNGDLVWDIQGHDAQCCNFVPHNDGYSLYYGNPANSADQNANILQVVQHFYRYCYALPRPLH